MKIVFLLPSKSRPTKFFNTVENIIENCVTEDYEIISVCDESDETMNNQDVRLKISEYPKLTVYYHETEGKISAINTCVQHIPDDASIIVLLADDIFITEKGFDVHIEEDMKQFFPDGKKGLINYPDQIVGDRQITMPVMSKSLIDYFGYIYNPNYRAVFCDNEQLAVVKQLGYYKFVNKRLYEHRHTIWGLSANDDLNRYNESFYHTDKETFFKRQKNNFDL